jgi:Tol biopolymer transport system component
MQPVWVDREGVVTPVDEDWFVQVSAAGNWSGLDLSPSGRFVATTDGTGGGFQVWVKDLQENAPPYRITFEGTFHARPRWAADEESVTFISNMGDAEAPTGVWEQAADGSGSPRLLHQLDVEIEEAARSPGGEWLVYRTGGTTAGRDIAGIRPGQDSAPRPLVATDADEKSPRLSPDGRWLAYVSDETGQSEVFIRPFPDVEAGKWQASQGGGTSPLWSRSGDELFFLSLDGRVAMMAAQVTFRDRSLSVRSREALFSITGQYIDANYTAFAVAPDDERFLMFEFGDSGGGSVVWVHNWRAEWKRRSGEGEGQ